MRDESGRLPRSALMAAAPHVLYEHDMLIAGSIYVTRGLSNAMLNNLMVESCLLHTRNLGSFFRARVPGRPGDLIARDFLPTWDARDVIPWADLDAISKYLAHLTVNRIDQRDWNVLGMATAIGHAWAEFLAGLRTKDPALAAVFRMPDS